MVTIKTLKDFIKRSFPHLTDEEIERARIIINSKAINHYVPEECFNGTSKSFLWRGKNTH